MENQVSISKSEDQGSKTLSHRNEFLFLYDIKMGNPNGDPYENRPRVLPDNTVFVTDVRLKRFIRDYFKQIGEDILVDTIDEKTTNLTGRVADYLEKNKQPKATGKRIVEILQDAFIDARLFGSSYAFKAEEETDKKKEKWEPKPIPKTMTGPVQINMGEIIHDVEFVDIHGTSKFGSDEEKSQGTFTQFYGIRYGLIAFSGVANENSAKIAKLTDDDYDLFIKALWRCVRESANTRTKKGQIPHFLLNIVYKSGKEFQFGRLQDYVKAVPSDSNKGAKQWSSPNNYKLDISVLIKRLTDNTDKIEKILYQKSDDVTIVQEIPSDEKWINLEIDK
ncbi:MAG TPA: type I-B CRISPR-associated protein Cas7/Csh2 [Candidatus Marinimicrobia bacterium]|nr:type I-B CRISPR-associated protein Cas7/Csh2 [Candidatus Neomarinimicrobiota bacterium]